MEQNVGTEASGIWMGSGDLSRNQTLQGLASENQDTAGGSPVPCSGGPGLGVPLSLLAPICSLLVFNSNTHQHQLSSPCFLSRQNTQEFQFPGYYRHLTPPEGGTQPHPERDGHCPCLDTLAQPAFLENITGKVQVPPNRICLPLTVTPFGFSSQKQGAASVLFGIGGINGAGRKSLRLSQPLKQSSRKGKAYKDLFQQNV